MYQKCLWWLLSRVVELWMLIFSLFAKFSSIYGGGVILLKHLFLKFYSLTYIQKCNLRWQQNKMDLHILYPPDHVLVSSKQWEYMEDQRDQVPGGSGARASWAITLRATCPRDRTDGNPVICPELSVHTPALTWEQERGLRVRVHPDVKRAD